MRTIKLFFLLAPAFFACASVNAQVTIGGLKEPKAGAILDLNSTVKGGLLLSNVDITNLDSIPKGSNTFSGVSPDSLDVNWGLRGAIVYNTNPETVPGIFVWTGRYWMPADETEPVEQILFTVRIGSDGGYDIPTSGMLNFTNHDYDWDVTVDGQPATATNCIDGRCEGTSGMFDNNATGIQLSGLTPGNRQIRITPHGEAAPGWGNAFGYCGDLNGTLYPYGANAVTSREKLISIDAPLTTLAFAPKTGESNANFMFGGVFSGCTSLTAPAVIRDSYKLPATVTNLSYFLAGIHLRNDALAIPIDLKHLKNWLKNNSSIKNLSYFLAGIYFDSYILAAPIDLTPLRDWFKGNQSIEDLSYFLYSTYENDISAAAGRLTKPMDLTPLSGWFKNNGSIKNLTYFLHKTYKRLPLATPVDLTPLSGWFNANSSITDLSFFLYETHNQNHALTAPINLTPLKDWFDDGRKMTNLSSFLYYTHYNNTSLTLKGQPIFPNWIKTMKEGNTPIQDVNGTFSGTFYLNSEKNNDIGEPTFQDGTTVLSSMGNPSSPKYTYQGRTGITNNATVGVNWK